MAQSLLISPSANPIRSPAPKRFRFSLKQDKALSQEPADFVSPKKAPLVDNSLKSQEDVLVDLQDENVSPNKILEVKLSCFVNPEVVDRKNDISALGLPNCGNTCYLNSILQVLRYSPNFLSSLHSLVLSQVWLDQASPDSSKMSEADLFHKLHMLFTTMKKQEDFLYKNFEKDFTSFLQSHLESLLQSLREVSSSFEEGEQHDAHELLLTILSRFTVFYDRVKNNIAVCCNGGQHLSCAPTSEMNGSSNELLKMSSCKEKRKVKSAKRGRRLSFDIHPARKSEITSAARQDISNCIFSFEGKMSHIVQCLECEKKSERQESFTNLEVSLMENLINEGSVDLCQCLDQRIILSGENKYFCEDCCHLNEAQLTSKVILLPSVLLIHCNWLKQSSVITRLEKDSTKLAIPTIIKTSENSNIFHSTTDDIYCLYAVVLHLGTSTENGHYVSFIRDRSISSELVNKENYTNMEGCCACDGILNMKQSPSNRWLLFDDQNVTPIRVNESSDMFPYYQFLGIAASPCIIFYYKM